MDYEPSAPGDGEPIIDVADRRDGRAATEQRHGQGGSERLDHGEYDGANADSHNDRCSATTRC
jgi:hypothetical protein